MCVCNKISKHYPQIDVNYRNKSIFINMSPIRKLVYRTMKEEHKWQTRRDLPEGNMRQLPQGSHILVATTNDLLLITVKESAENLKVSFI